MTKYTQKIRGKLNSEVQKYGNGLYEGLGDLLTTNIDKKGLIQLGLASTLLFGSIDSPNLYSLELLAGHPESVVNVEKEKKLFIDELMNIRTRTGNFVFLPLDAFEFMEAGGTIEYAKQIANITDENGKPRYSNFDMPELVRNNVSIGEAENFANIPLKDAYPNSLEPVNDILRFREKNIDFNYAKEISSIKDKENNLAFSTDDVVDFATSINKRKIPPEFIKILYEGLYKNDSDNLEKKGIEKYLSPEKEKIIKYFILSSSPYLDELKDADNIVNFKDTKKPNALVILPKDDRKGAFYSPESMLFYKDLMKEYDVLFRVVNSEKEVYNAINQVPDISLLILGGHGSPNSIYLGNSGGRLSIAGKEDSYYIDISDTELKNYLDKLNSNAIVFLYSCSNGEGGKNRKNLANFVSGMGNGKKVISSKKPFSDQDIKINSIYPFDIEIIPSENSDSNYTYTQN